MNSAALRESIKSKAIELGFMSCGIARADFLEEEARGLEAWLKADYHGSMKWMENHFDKRLDPRKLMPGAKSVVSVLFNYDPPKRQDLDYPKISAYAYGEDYHFVIKRKLKSLLQYIREEVGEVEGRVFVDSAPVMDRAWAKRAGLGWIGKHSLLLNRQSGSYFFIGEIILNLELEADTPVQPHCGTCTKCMDACPTEAIIKPEVVDATKCISYLTIELKEAIPNQFAQQMEGWAFGCDICQDVCPWNRFSKPHEEAAFSPKEGFLEMSEADWEELSEESFRRLFKHSAVKRAGYDKLMQNIRFVKEGQGGSENS